MTALPAVTRDFHFHRGYLCLLFTPSSPVSHLSTTEADKNRQPLLNRATFCLCVCEQIHTHTQTIQLDGCRYSVYSVNSPNCPFSLITIWDITHPGSITILYVLWACSRVTRIVLMRSNKRETEPTDSHVRWLKCKLYIWSTLIKCIVNRIHFGHEQI